MFLTGTPLRAVELMTSQMFLIGKSAGFRRIPAHMGFRTGTIATKQPDSPRM
jgi:hypothetical protein